MLLFGLKYDTLDDLFPAVWEVLNGLIGLAGRSAGHTSQRVGRLEPTPPLAHALGRPWTRTLDDLFVFFTFGVRSHFLGGDNCIWGRSSVRFFNFRFFLVQLLRTLRTERKPPTRVGSNESLSGVATSSETP